MHVRLQSVAVGPQIVIPPVDQLRSRTGLAFVEYLYQWLLLVLIFELELTER